jgi:hypothetical protein
MNFISALRQTDDPESEDSDSSEIDMKYFACMAAMLLVVTATPTVAAQKELCNKRPKIIRHLAKKFSETPVAIGLSRSGGVIELLSSAKGGSWTIIITTPTGTPA